MKSQSPPKPSTPVLTNPLLDRLDPTQRKVLLLGLIAFFVLAGMTTLLLAYYIYEPEITSFLQKSTPGLNSTQVSQSKLPTMMNIPTQAPACSGASLQIGTTNLRLESTTRAVDGTVNVPEDTPGVAYWIEDLENNYVFALSPTPENLTLLSALQGGEDAVITWENCNSATYVLSAPQPGDPGADILKGQPASEIIVYIPGSASASGVYVQGGLVGETITVPPTAEPSSTEINAEISLVETSTSDDQKTIQVVISILNYGSEPITLSESDITLTPVGAAPLALSLSDPKLPQKIQSNESKVFTLVFPWPGTVSATLKIFTIEYDLEY